MYDLLNRLTLIEGSAFVAAPYAGLTFAQMGCEVIRFDPPGGGLDYRRMPRDRHSGASLYWHGLNKGKRSLCVDIRQPEGRELIQDLVCQSGPGNGLLLTNFAGLPWLDYERLRERREDVIKLTISGNPDNTTAVDYTVNALTGVPFITGPDERPVNHVLPAWDLTCGLHAAFSLLAAVIQRSLNGQGAHIELALSDVALTTIGHLGWFAEAEQYGDRQPSGNDLYGGFGRDFRCADGRSIMLVGLTRKQFQAGVKACDIAERVERLAREHNADFSDEADVYAHRQTIGEWVGEWCAARSSSDIGTLFDRHGICWAPYLTTHELLSDRRGPAHSPLFSRIDQAGIGAMLAPGTATRWHAHERKTPAPAPRLGEHTEQILTERLGLSSTAIGRLIDRGIVALAEGTPAR